MIHYHILNKKGKTVDLTLTQPSGKPYKVCDLSFSWTGSDRKWHGDKYNPNGICINHCREDLNIELLK